MVGSVKLWRLPGHVRILIDITYIHSVDGGEVGLLHVSFSYKLISIHALYLQNSFGVAYAV